SDLVELCNAALDGKLDEVTAEWDPRAALGVVLAAGGYPASYPKGDVISGLPETGLETTKTQDSSLDSKVFHAGTAEKDGQVVTAGGRVLCAVGLGDTVSEAQARAYELTKQISWNKVYYRTDIGYRAVAREQV
ncbi:MAG: phosphoribosylamine--glycine ligase, partial [Gammaproteobacteria bacterium]|nr:phosphoribosylamine--glycine ligase [Gammaproteobacteria bacterium]